MRRSRMGQSMSRCGPPRASSVARATTPTKDKTHHSGQCRLGIAEICPGLQERALTRFARRCAHAGARKRRNALLLSIGMAPAFSSIRRSLTEKGYEGKLPEIVLSHEHFLILSAAHSALFPGSDFIPSFSRVPKADRCFDLTKINTRHRRSTAYSRL
jgi:hypothetical protein